MHWVLSGSLVFTEVSSMKFILFPFFPISLYLFNIYLSARTLKSWTGKNGKQRTHHLHSHLTHHRERHHTKDSNSWHSTGGRDHVTASHLHVCFINHASPKSLPWDESLTKMMQYSKDY